MIPLGFATAADKLEITLGQAVDVDTVAGYVDHTLSTDNVEAQRPELHTYNTASTQDLVSGPATGVMRAVHYISIRNRHASLSVDVTVRLNPGDSATNYEIHKTNLAAGEMLYYEDKIGWVEIPSTSLMDNRLLVTADVDNATTSFADITGLTCPVLSGHKYNFEAHIYHIENASTTGARFGINGPTMTAMRVAGFSLFAGSLTAATFNAHTADVAAVDTSILGVTTSSAGTPQVAIAIMSGFINPSADGTFACRSQSEVAVAAGVKVKAGSWCRIWEPNA